MASETGSRTGPIEISLPFEGRWLAQNSPARRVPSHGSEVFGERYAIDFVRVDDRRRTARTRDWRTWFGTEPAERYYGFGEPILAPGSGTVVDVHDGEPDHEGRRSQLALLSYALGQAGRLRQGVVALAGNYVTIALPTPGAFVAVAHLQQGSVRVRVGQDVVAGEPVGNCGNSGNSTEPHVHLQVMDSADLSLARGRSMVFRRFRERPAGAEQFFERERAVPAERAVVEPLAGAEPPPRGRPR